MSEIVELIRGSVIPYPNSAVFISGGLDSTILLHHLSEKTEETIRTYTVGLPEENEFAQARQVSEYYGTKHTELSVKDILTEFRRIIPKLDRPRFNLWPLYAYRAAQSDGIVNVYIAEGMDEHFGGYENKPKATPQELWAGVIEWTLPTHKQLAALYGVNLQTPFVYLPLRLTINYWRDPHTCGIAKKEVKRAYQSLIPRFVLDRHKVAGRLNWEIPEVWDREIRPIINVECPPTHEAANKIINGWVTRVWLEGQNEE